jgi:esterase/lipase
MKEQQLKIEHIPAIVLGEKSKKVFLFIHGQGGNKEEAKAFAEVACPKGWQVIGIDLPQHGERVESDIPLDPWHVIPELHKVMQYVKERWQQVALRASSVGCWFSLQAFAKEPLVQSLFVSPLVDMERMIQNLMHWAGVTEEQLEREQVIPTDFGHTLSWEYLSFVRTHPIDAWNVPTYILRAKEDEQIDGDTVEKFSTHFGCKLTIIQGGEHWFHTPEELVILGSWESETIKNI